MDYHRTYTILACILCISILYVSLLYVNMNYSLVYIPHKNIIAVVGLYTLYYIPYVFLFNCICDKSWKIRLFGLIGCYLLWKLLFPSMYFLIQEWMPRVDLQLFEDNKDYDPIKFQRRLISAYAMVVLVAAVTVAGARVAWHYHTIRHLNRELLTLQELLVGKDIKNHFIRNLLSTNFGMILLNSKPEQKKNIHKTVEMLAYFMRIDNEKENVVGLDEEVIALQRFVSLLKQYYGDKAVIEKGRFSPTNNIVPIGLLLLPLENVLKYAKISPSHPIVIAVEKQVDAWLITFNNVIDKGKVERNISSGTGISNMKRIIVMLNLAIAIDTMEVDGVYIFKINIKNA